MRGFLAILKVENIKKNLIQVITRFPVGFLIMLGVSISLLLLTHGDFSNSVNDILSRLLFSLIITFFFSIGLSIYSESTLLNIKKRIYLQILPIIFGILFYLGFNSNIDNFQNIVFFLVSLFGIIGFLFFAPYIKNLLTNKTDQTVYYTYFYNMSIVFLTSIILGFILFILGSIGISAIFTLFDLRDILSNNVYADWSIFAMSFFTPIYALTQIPNKKEFTKNHFNENVFFSFLIKYIAIPFIYVYFIILYAYTVKVLASFGYWPKGEVSWLVIGFSIFGYIIYIFSYIFEEKNKLIRVFRKYFPYAVIPQIFMLFYAIYLRIAQYDITTNRYFVVVFGIGLLIISVYFMLSKKKYLGYMPFIITVISIVISIGPWSVYNLPESRQSDRLINNLEIAGILVEGKLMPLKDYDNISKDLSTQIYDSIGYLCNFNDCKTIKSIFSDQYSIILEDKKIKFEQLNHNDLELYKENSERIKEINERIFEEPRAWEIQKEITQYIKVKSYYGSNSIKDLESIYINLDYNSSHFPIDIQNFNQLIKITNSPGDNEYIYAKVNLTEEILNIYIDGVIKDTIDIASIIKELTLKSNSGVNTQLLPEDLSFKLSSKVYDVNLLIENINVKNPQYTGEINNFYNNINGYLLIKQK